MNWQSGSTAITARYSETAALRERVTNGCDLPKLLSCRGHSGRRG